MQLKHVSGFFTITLALLSPKLWASEADIRLPDLSTVSFLIGNKLWTGTALMHSGLWICVIGLVFGIYQYIQTKNLPVHQSMRDVSQTIWETCKTYLTQQGKFLTYLWVLIAVCISYYFG